MEELLTKVNLLDSCFKQYSKQDISNMDNNQVRNLCLDEKNAFAAHLFSDKVTTKNLIPERISIIRANKSKVVDQRKLFMDSF